MPGVDPAIPSSNNPNVRMMERLATLERELATLKRQLQGQAVSQIPVVTTLGTAGRIGRIVMLRVRPEAVPRHRGRMGTQLLADFH
jgi:hypothetical protein